MVQEVTMQQVASFQVFIRDNKPKMTMCYPFLSQEQIMCKLRQQWKQLDDPKRWPYSKLVLAKKKKVKTIKVKVVTVTKSRTYKGRQSQNSKCLDISRKNDSEENFGFDISDDSYSKDANSPFMQNKSAVESLNSDCSPGLNKPAESFKKRGRGQTYGGSMFGVDCVSRITSESVDSSRPGILQTPCKNRQNTRAHVSFSTVQETLRNLNGNESSDEAIDEEVLCIESSTENKTDTNSGNTCRSKFFEEIVPRRIDLQQVEDNFLTLGFRDTQGLKYCFAAGELGEMELKNQKCIVKTAEKTTTVVSPDGTPSRFSKRLRNLWPDDDVSGTLPSRSLHHNPTIYLNKKPKIVSELCKEETLSVRNNTTLVDKRGPTFPSESQDLSEKVALQSCVHENINVLPDKLHRSRYIHGPAENVTQEIKLNNELKNKAGVNRKHFSEKSGRNILDCKANDCVARFSSRVATYSHNLSGFGSPQATNSCARSTEHRNDSYFQEGLTTSSVKISQKLYSDFSEKYHFWKDGNKFRVSDEESDSEFGDGEGFLKNNTVRKAPCHTGKTNVSAGETHLKTDIRKKSGSLNTDSFKRESIILGKKVDSSEEEDDIEFDDNDGCDKDNNQFSDDGGDKNDTKLTGTNETGKKRSLAVGAYLGKVDNSHKEITDFDDVSDKDNAVSTQPHQTRKAMNSTVGACLKKVDNSDEENGNEFDDDDNKKNDTIPTGQCQTKIEMRNSAVAYLTESTRKKCDFDLHKQERDINKKGVERRGEKDNKGVYKNASLLKKNIYSNDLCYRNKQNTFHTYSKRGTLNGAERRSFHSSGKGTYSLNKVTDTNQECDTEIKEFDQIVSSYKNDVKNVPCTTKRNTSRSNDDLSAHKGNNYYQANRIIDPLRMNKKNSTQKKQVAGAKNKIKQVNDKISGNNKPEKGPGCVEHRYSKTENGFFRKYPASGMKQTDKPKGENQQKSALDQKISRSFNHTEEIRNNNVTRLNAFTSDNFGGNKSCILPVSFGNGIIHHKSQLNNSSRKQKKHMQENCGHQTLPCKEPPNLDVWKLKHVSGLNKGSGKDWQRKDWQRKLFPEVDCRNTSNIDCRINCKMDCKNNISNTDCRMNRKMDCKQISTADHINKSRVSGEAKDECKSDAESDTSGSSLVSETDEDEGKTKDDFLVNMADQTTSALLQAIDRLKSLTSPQMMQADECLFDGGPVSLSQPENRALPSVPTQLQSLCSMFQDITHSTSKVYQTPAQQRLLASSVTETPSNFMMMFDENDIFL